jgi:Cd2+/Zn2+-exporting ATPase
MRSTMSMSSSCIALAWSTSRTREPNSGLAARGFAVKGVEMESKDGLRLQIRGLDCPECAASLEKAVQQLDGVEMAQLVFSTSTLHVTRRDGAEVRPQIERLTASLGYELEAERAEVAEPGGSAQGGWRLWLRRRRREVSAGLGGLLLLSAAILGLLGGAQPLVNGLYAASIVVGGIYIARAGWIALRTARSLDMNVLMTIAAVGAMFVGEFAEGAVTVFLFSIGELLESYTTDRARRAIRDLVGLAPETATLKEEHGERSVAVSELRLDDAIIIRPGERIPMDGEILEGRSAVNQAPITGESIPVSKAPGDGVFAGTINGNGALTVKVTHLAQDNTIARIMHLVEQAQSKRAPAQRFVDRFARVYTPIVIALALLIALLPPLIGLGPLSEWVYRALVLLVIACPCASGDLSADHHRERAGQSRALGGAGQGRALFGGARAHSRVRARQNWHAHRRPALCHTHGLRSAHR